MSPDVHEQYPPPNEETGRAFQEAERRIAKAAEAEGLTTLNLSIRWLTKIPALESVPKLQSLTIDHTQVADLTPLACLTDLKRLILSGTQVSVLSPLRGLTKIQRLSLDATQVSDLSPLSHMPELEWLDLYGPWISDLRPLASLPRLRVLALVRTNVLDFSPLSGLTALTELRLTDTKMSNLESLSHLKNLQYLDLTGTEVSDLKPLATLTELHSLHLDGTKVFDISPLAVLTSLIDGVGPSSGLWLGSCPLADQALLKMSSLENPLRTQKIINYLRVEQGLPPYIPEIDSVVERLADVIGVDGHEPLEGLPAPFEFALNDKGKIALVGNPVDRPFLPLPNSAHDFRLRLDACRILADDILADVGIHGYQVRVQYGTALKRYAERLPIGSGEGNILLADSQARYLRNLFAADVENLAAPFAASLKVLLENHIGLRAYYPEVSNFYSDVRTGRLTTPLPIDAVEGFVHGMDQFTPDVFEPSVPEALGQAQEPVDLPAAPSELEAQLDTTQPLPPPDPLGEIEPYKAHGLATASTLNKIWKVFLQGKQIHGAAEEWIAAAKMLGPFAQVVLKWLYDYRSSGGSH